ncbi:DUF302 domain-containing protein [Photobacterium sp. DNB23_23_1]|uniref:DUF302 domain-containing protein n=1 Tax=Photobacterium pectinilyticum TaxID=2906793 RepID=A0ABT1N2J4_9GAMM|nr:DUF302 domain-containing protein [Photobacterium sp. ZSDE20]MCQ1057971.1 DUF302 domain-containing protein [Photobacterium sp. ZSDE20]MDD1822503.1 DUF302 domain-containing protein [Photobacterium sp. ZSDE20]
MKIKLLLFLFFINVSYPALADNGLVSTQSPYTVPETTAKLKQVLKDKGMTLFAHVKHSESAKEAGVDLRPTELLIFGNPKIGSVIMSCQQSVAIDLPQKFLVTEDENKDVWVTYNSPIYLAARHGINMDSEKCRSVIEKVSKALNAMVPK